MAEFPIFDETIAKNLKKASVACYDNGQELLDEANILYDNCRYARAISLAILAEEELSKAMVLYFSSISKKWNRELYNILKKHEYKHAVSGSMSSYIKAIISHVCRSRSSLIPLEFDFADQLADKITESKKECIDKELRDRRKQFAQFVSIGKTGLPSKTPSEFKKKDAECEIDRVVIFTAYLKMLYGIRPKDDSFFRSSTNILYDNNITTICHHSGVTIHMEPFAWVDNGGCADEVTMNPFKFLTKLKSFNPEKLDEKQKNGLAKIYKAYDFQGQIRSEMKRLGLRGADYLDEVEQVIKKYA